MQKVYSQILGRIAGIYDKYENQANQKSQEKRKKLGAQIDKKEKQFLNDLIRIQQNTQNLVKDIQKSPNSKNTNVASAYKNINNTLKDIQSITKKKSLMFKVNDHLTNLAATTNDQINMIRKLLPKAADSGMCCGGGDGQKKFKQAHKRFQAYSFQWRMLAQLQPKDSIQNFISPKFDSNQYSFLNKILRDNWPKPSQPKVVQKIKQKQVIKQVHVGGQTRCSLANQYLYGINRQQNPSQGLKIYHQQAEKKDSAACSFLGQVYQQGILLPQNLTKSMKYYQTSNKPYAKYRFAMSLIRGKLNQGGINRSDIEKGHRLLLQLSQKDQMCPQALVQLGQLYEKGSFDCDQERVYRINSDLKQAINYYKKARNLYLPRASNNLGVLYFNNKYISQADPNSKITTQSNAQDNLERAKKYLQQAQQQGFCRSFYNLGCIYQKGLIGKKDPEKALKYFYQGGLKGDIQAKLKFAYQLMKQTSIMKQQYDDHYKIAHKWLQGIILKRQFLQDVQMQSKKLTQLQKAQAMFYLGLMYQFGFGVEKSPKRAFNFFLQSSDLQYPAAKNKVGDCYFSGYGVRQDRQMAIGCYLQASDLNNADAMVNLGTIYLNGIPGLVQRNYTKAYDNFIKAMDLDNSDAMIHLSYMYRNGLGFDSQPQMAKKLLEEAAKNKNSTALYMLKEMGGQFDQRVLFDNLDNQFFPAPKKINLKEIVPIIPNAKSVSRL